VPGSRRQTRSTCCNLANESNQLISEEGKLSFPFFLFFRFFGRVLRTRLGAAGGAALKGRGDERLALAALRQGAADGAAVNDALVLLVAVEAVRAALVGGAPHLAARCLQHAAAGLGACRKGLRAGHVLAAPVSRAAAAPVDAAADGATLALGRHQCPARAALGRRAEHRRAVHGRLGGRQAQGSKEEKKGERLLHRDGGWEGERK
jgi:hypothetical protein